MTNGERSVTEIDGRMGTPVPSQGLTQLTHVIYALHLFSAVTGLLGTAFVVTAFLTGWPSIIAVILNYIKRSEVRGTYLDSHFGWQIRTFWYALLWVVIGLLLIITVIGILFGWVVLFAAGIWVLYRIIRGWLALFSEKPMPA
ncbi:MAG TPA: hypothetical protein VLW45_07325 [Pelomicrobium sp.]|nr:hypothetical protein [Pelomicrobium sp.]